MINLAAADVRAILVKTTTSVDTQDGIQFIAGYAVLGECTCASYTRKALTGEAIAIDLVNKRAEFTSDPIVWSALEAGNTLQGVLLYVHVTNDADSMPIAFLEFASNWVTDGGGLTLTPNAQGLLQVA